MTIELAPRGVEALGLNFPREYALDSESHWKPINTTGNRVADIFIKIDGIAGESQDATHPDEIEVPGWNWNVTQQSRMHSGSGGGAAKASELAAFIRKETGLPGYTQIDPSNRLEDDFGETGDDAAPRARE